MQKKKLNNLKEKNGNEEVRNLKKKDNKINKILGDIETYNQFKQKLKILEENIENIYKEIYEFLDKYRANEIYNSINEKIKEKGALPVSKKYLDNILLSDVKKEKKLFRKRKSSSCCYYIY